MVTGGTFTHRNIRKRIRLGPDDRIGNQIDHVIINQLQRLDVLDVRNIEVLMLIQIDI